MDFLDQVKNLSQTIQQIKESVLTEEATKQAFILPLLNALGYNVFNPLEVCPEYGADAPGVNAKKVDYVILLDNKPAILIECKSWKEKLNNPKHNSQLFHYFASTKAKFSVLTNGILYRFYTDIVAINVMDDKPFFEFSMLDFTDSDVIELKRFSKSSFKPDEMGDIAKNLLYTKEIKTKLAKELKEPSSDFVRFFVKDVYGSGSNRITDSVINKFTEIVKKSADEFINEEIAKRLGIPNHNSLNLITIPDEPTKLIDDSNTDDGDKISDTTKGIETTPEELEGFYIVKSILRETIDSKRIRYKDTQNYFGINIDDRATKTICRLGLNSPRKYIGLIDIKGKETRESISDLDEIYKFSENLKERVSYLLKDVSSN
ncbi:type I restriction enzyme HsdR N-terminal domain-containing protein [Sphaerospermopsis sp. FACHB-1094]|jgi:hypothetical protein|uniref:type I restriction endonuclease n=1 Tax=Sphaerospermopsis sp. FACHB-1094 TaxID=2692861 RepID=UPI0016898431|nr:type I restriction endonuclease [Sphaerospermopsis sp. FACHB-1094]MBD2134293.1 type I restriction enzyme HsdR N-terminal domain-containing protein [Sphaerospermopsis sp. FACHB-1094]